MANKKFDGRAFRKARIRKKLQGTAERPRLTVYKSLRYVYAQIIDDLSGHTLASASSLKKGDKSGSLKSAIEVGKEVAEKAKALKINEVAFDRNGFIYHGVIKALADAAREAGLKF